MVVILDGYSEIGAHVKEQSLLFDPCLRHVINGYLFSEKTNIPSLMRNMLSDTTYYKYHGFGPSTGNLFQYINISVPKEWKYTTGSKPICENIQIYRKASHLDTSKNL